jgi:hypothetical protein
MVGGIGMAEKRAQDINGDLVVTVVCIAPLPGLCHITTRTCEALREV